ncbi:amidohydrolase [Rhizorhabdus phycosphaerae]|uniref:amidohydrolase n=1 Tax=Rhizorhabdus phycosphaerae TaxID=2711156 RepID=UPI0013EAF1B0|nr:amidohydrolase [Rhizorhabdus phycosphaerae]
MRRDLHAHPELGFEETRTASLVAEKLRQWGIEAFEGIGGTGVVGVIKGKRPGSRAVGLRADMDALAIHEETGLAYASAVEGKMHACGHDGHTAMLLGAARYLAEHPDFEGQVNLIFQPSEENVEGALAMIGDGLFERFPCDAVYGLHNTAGMPNGHFATRRGAMMAAGDFWSVTFRGVGGHGGLSPQLSTDITYAQAHFVLGLQGIIGRNVPPLEPAVISVGYIGGGQLASPNVIPAELVLAGTARSYSDEVRDTIERRIAELAYSTAEAWGCGAETHYIRGSCALINQPAQVDIAVAAAEAVVGAENVDDALRPTTGSEDFAELSRRCPGAFMRIGNGAAADGAFHAPHTPFYDFNDAIIPDGIRYWVNIVRRELGHASDSAQVPG